MEYLTLCDLAHDRQLAVFGAFHPVPEDGAPDGTGTLILLGPAEPGFWRHVNAEPEFTDDKPDPLDRWSRRVIGSLACDLGAMAQFPFGGPPHAPFLRWATRSGRAWSSPIMLLVHDAAGLMVSYRGALALKELIALPAPPEAAPCVVCCAQPCVTACPVNALTAAGYNLDACHNYLHTEPGQDCLARGCAVRRTCPVSQNHGRLPEQSGFHMRAFHP